MSTAPYANPSDDEIDTNLGERYYKNDKAVEERLTEEISEVIRHFIDRRFHEGRRPALRDAHARDNGCVTAIFRIDADIPNSLRHGVLSAPNQEFPAWVRFSNANSEVLDPRLPDARGMAIKLMGVKGRKLLDDENETQDFIMVNNPVFFVGDLLRYKNSLVKFHSGGYLRQFLAICQLNFREKIRAFKVNSSWTTNPLYCQYWSMTPYRLGPANGGRAIKFTAKPRIGRKPSIGSRISRFSSPRFSLKEQMASILSSREMWFDFFIQLYKNDQAAPVEDTLFEWDDSVSKLVHVAKIVIPVQDLESADRNTLCENLSFNPWHCLIEHKPLGVVNRVRKSIYLKMSDYRHKLNRADKREPMKDDV